MAKIEFKNGSLLSAPETIKIHQVNCMNRMGSGVALQVKKKYPKAYRKYTELFIENNAIDLLGNCQMVSAGDSIIVNMFSQYKYGYDNKRYTDYEAMKRALKQLKWSLKFTDYRAQESIAFPYNIGCCRGGGDWNTVLGIITDTFEDWDGMIVFYKYGE